MRAFSDSEIITIAAVAAAALGGIVIGLGRGQENASDQLTGAADLRGAGQRALETGKSIARTPPTEAIDRSRSQITSTLRSAIEEAKPVADDFVRRAPSVRQPEVNLSRSKSPKAPLERMSDKFGTALLKTISSAASGIASDSGSSKGPQFNDVPAVVADFARNLVQSDEGRSESTSSSGDGILTRVAQEVADLERGLSAAPDRVRSTSRQGKAALRERVAKPVSSAAGSTGSAMKESLAALAWLSAGAGIVYFGLLSDERREQVKDALCGTMEHVRLLALDFKGYEPEM